MLSQRRPIKQLDSTALAPLDGVVGPQHRFTGRTRQEQVARLGEGVALASHGTANEGWFDGPALMQGFRRKARERGVDYIEDEVVGLAPHEVALRTGRTIDARTIVIAAGPRSGEVAAMASIALPVEPRRRRPSPRSSKKRRIFVGMDGSIEPAAACRWRRPWPRWRMKKILVATDFSTRSDRAVRRATLLARKFDAAVSLVHVIDDDRPKRIVDTERELTSVLLGEQARSVREIDGVDCSAEVLLGAPSDEMIKAAQAGRADILVIGPHRHHAFLDVFRGTTAERTIRSGSHPLLVANGVPAGFYRHILAAVDLSEGSGDALRALADLGLDKLAAVSVVYVFSAPARSHMAVASASSEDIEDYLAGEEKRAGGELAEFLRGLAISPARQVLKLDESSVAHIICATAREVSADLIVVGTRGLTGVTKFLLGSVAEEVLHISDRDVLAVPRRRGT